MKTVKRKRSTPLDRARRALYKVAGGSVDSGDETLAHISTAQRIEYIKSKAFQDWVAAERAAGREVFWLKDVDKTQAAGDLFTYFFKFRADNNLFSAEQLAVIEKFLRSRKGARAEDSATPHDVLRLWQAKEEGGEGLGLLDFWRGIYWPSQVGMTREEKQRQVEAFAPLYASRVYPGVAEENRLLEAAGVNVVIVSNGDQELAIACAGILGVNPDNVVGSHLKYLRNGRARGVNHSYEVFDEDWETRPQPGKILSFHYWLHKNRHRFGWDHIVDENVVIAGRDGDSASSDGGMMIYTKPPAIGNFIVNTPGEPGRAEKFYKLARVFGWSRGQFITLEHQPSPSGRFPD